MSKFAGRFVVASLLLSLLAFASSRVSDRDLADTIHTELVCHGGCTVDPRTGETVGKVDAYAVSLAGYERAFIAMPSRGSIRNYLRRHAPILARRPRLFVGAWRDGHTGRCYLDLTELIPDRRTAVARGRANDQRCIYHMATSGEIRLTREERRSTRIPAARPIRR